MTTENKMRKTKKMLGLSRLIFKNTTNKKYNFGGAPTGGEPGVMAPWTLPKSVRPLPQPLHHQAKHTLYYGLLQLTASRQSRTCPAHTSR